METAGTENASKRVAHRLLPAHVAERGDGYERSPLAPAMATMLGTQRPAPGGEQALGWMVIGKGDDQLIVHDGGTFGYASSMVWDPKKRVGVVVLTNHVADVGDVARHLLRPNRPL